MHSMKHAISGRADYEALSPILNESLNRAWHLPVGLDLELDCREALDLTSFALENVARCRRELRRLGGDLRLTGASECVRSRMVHPLLGSLCE